MNIRRIFSRPALHAVVAAVAIAGLPITSSAGVGLVTNTDLYGYWTAANSGFTGCGQTAMHVAVQMGSAGTGNATITQHGQCGNRVIAGQTFRVLTLDSNGTGTANLSCGVGCGWNLRIQVSPDRQIMNLVSVDPVNPGNYIAGVAVHY